MTIKTGEKLPQLELPLVGGGTKALGDPAGARFIVLVFYRGLHCLRCNPYLNLYEAMLPEFEALGAEVIAVSVDVRAKAEQSYAEWGLKNLKMAYGFPIADAPAWGLYVTDGTRPQDPPQFVEPALFITGPDGALDHGIINTAQRLRPDPAAVLDHLKDRIAEARG